MFGDISRRCKHTDSEGSCTNHTKGTGTDDVAKPSNSELPEDLVEYKEIPLLFQHKTKKPRRQVVKMLRGLKGDQGVEEIKTKSPGIVGMEKVTDDPKAVDLKKRIKKPAKRVAKTVS